MAASERVQLLSTVPKEAPTGNESKHSVVSEDYSVLVKIQHTRQMIHSICKHILSLFTSFVFEKVSSAEGISYTIYKPSDSVLAFCRQGLCCLYGMEFSVLSSRQYKSVLVYSLINILSY